MPKRELRADMYVLDSLANDVEDLDSILRLLNGSTEFAWRGEWGRAFRREDVVASLSRLIRRRAVRAYVLSVDGRRLEGLSEGVLPSGDFGDAHYGMTPHGRMMHSHWCEENGAEGS